MKTTVFYFSGTGNTWYVGKALSENLSKENHNSDFYSIEDSALLDREVLKSIIYGSDKIIIGYPIYGSLAPRLMDEFINNLPVSLDKIKVIVYTTVGLYSGDGPIIYRDLFEKKGYEFTGGYEFITSNNFNVPGFPDVLRVGNEEKIQRRNNKATRKAERVALEILEDSEGIHGDNYLARLCGYTQRKHVEGFFTKFNEILYVENDMCIKCNKCVRLCPVDNVKSVDGKIVFNNDCALCMRCYHFCPTGAINASKKSLNTDKWPRFKGPNKAYEKTIKKDL